MAEDEPEKKGEEKPSPSEEEFAKQDEQIKATNEAADRLEAANKEREKLITRQEEANVKATLAGKAEVTGKKEESNSDYATKALANDL